MARIPTWVLYCLDKTTAQHNVHSTGGSLRVFKQVAWLEVGSGKVALPRPAHPRVTPAVIRHVNGKCRTSPVKMRGNDMTLKRMDNVGIVVESLDLVDRAERGELVHDVG